MQNDMPKQKVTAFEWFIAARPWSLTASAVPICFGACLAALAGHWDTLLFILTFTGGVSLQVATNYHNTYGDFISGVDTVESAITCPQLVTGRIQPKAMHKAGWLAVGVAALAGLALIYLCGLWVLPFGIVGILGEYFYTNGKKPYKYRGIGPYFVFMLMGPLMALPTYFILTGSFHIAPVLGSLSIACLVSAIMHANDMRDINHDRGAGIETLAMRRGFKNSALIYACLNIGAFVFLGVNVFMGILPNTALLAFALLPPLLRELYKLLKNRLDIRTLEGWAAQFHLKFGLTLSLGVALAMVF